MERIEIANKIAAIVNGKVWTNEDKTVIRVYDNHRGFAIIDNDGNVNIDRVNGHEFSSYKAACEQTGVKAYRR